VKDGPVVVEKIINDKKEEIKHIKNNISKYEQGSIGILSKNESYLEDFKIEFGGIRNIHTLSMLESQGVEFDIVFIVGVDIESMEVKHHSDVLPEHLKERSRMQKDLLYVALTRAITELHILGKEKLGNILSNLKV
jgi:superfamily I DNA/RNA helicase